MFWKFHVTMARKTGQVYMHRWQLLKTRLLSVYVNKICLPDEDPWFHTHPWRASWSVKLWNSYTELVQYAFGKPLVGVGILFNRERVPGRISRIPERHRITELRGNKPVWTLFIGWKSDRPWGFVDPATGAVVPWKVRAEQRGMPLSAFSGGNQK